MSSMVVLLAFIHIEVAFTAFHLCTQIPVTRPGHDPSVTSVCFFRARPQRRIDAP